MSNPMVCRAGPDFRIASIRVKHECQRRLKFSRWACEDAVKNGANRWVEMSFINKRRSRSRWKTRQVSGLVFSTLVALVPGGPIVVQIAWNRLAFQQGKPVQWQWFQHGIAVDIGQDARQVDRIDAW